MPAPVVEQSSNSRVIAGGVISGLAVLSILIAVLLFYARRPHPPAPPASSMGDRQPDGFDPVVDQVSWPMSGQRTIEPSVPETIASPLRVYNADDPTTYPTYQGALPPQTYNHFQPPSPSSSRNLYTIATAPYAQGEGLRHNNLPLV